VSTNIEIDDKLMKDALKATGAKTKRAAVELGLKTLVLLRAQEKARDLKGKITWKTIDTLIATRCIEDGFTLLHADRDFLPFAQYLGLKVAYSET
jgi:Arc/MetJ family transcription regulator